MHAKIVLVNPPLGLKERYGNLAALGSAMPSLGLSWLAASCRGSGYTVAVIESSYGNVSPDAIVEYVVQRKIRYVGITAMTCGIYGASLLARKLKATDSGIRTLIGGAHITATAEETMRLFPEFDVGFIGEAEISLVEYLQTMDMGASLQNVKGIAYRIDGKIHITERRPFIEDLDSLPFPAWDLIPGFPNAYVPAAIRCRHLPAGHLVTSRGCPMKCSFCDRSVFGERYRFFSLEYTFAMIQKLCTAYGVKDVLFEDDSFTLHKKRVMSLCEMICGKGLRFSWSCLGRIDSIDAPMLRLMKTAGCWQIGFGIESGNAGILENADKKINLERIAQTLALTRAAKIHTKGFFILGLPGESSATIAETMRFADSAALDDISVSFATPFPGTVLFDQAHRFGAFTPTWEKMNLLSAVFVPKGLTKRQLEEYHSRFIRGFYFRPQVIADYLLRCSGDVKICMRILRGIFSFLRLLLIKKD